MADEPHLPRLIKLMKMTTSSNDGEALTAVRLANALLTKINADWEKLLLGKVQVVEDPFSRIATPDSSPRSRGTPTAPNRPEPATAADPVDWGATATSARTSAPRPPRQAQPSSTWQQSPPPPPPPNPSSSVKSTRPNQYAGSCYCCGVYIMPNAGFIIKPQHYTAGAMHKFVPVCDDCNDLRVPVPARAAKRRPAPTDAILNSI